MGVVVVVRQGSVVSVVVLRAGVSGVGVGMQRVWHVCGPVRLALHEQKALDEQKGRRGHCHQHQHQLYHQHHQHHLYLH